MGQGADSLDDLAPVDAPNPVAVHPPTPALRRERKALAPTKGVKSLNTLLGFWLKRYTL